MSSSYLTALQQPQQQPPPQPPTTLITSLDSTQDLFDFLDADPPNTLRVVKFYANHCALCRKVALKYKKIAKLYHEKPVQFAEMEESKNQPVFQALGIHKYPFLCVYRNGQCVAFHGTENATVFESIVKDTIQTELEMSPEQWNQFLSVFAEPIQRETSKLEMLREQPQNDKQ